MAEIEAGIKTRLGAFGATAALLVSGAEARVYPLRLPQDATLPAVTYQRIGGPRLEAIGGSTGYVKQRVQLDCWHSTYTGAKALAKAVKAALHRWSDEEADPPVKYSELVRDTDLDPKNRGVEMYRVSQDYEVLHAED